MRRSAHAPSVPQELDGAGVAYLAEPMIAPQIALGRLAALLDGSSCTLPGIFLYHPNRRQTPMPLQVFLRFIEKWRKYALTVEQRGGDEHEAFDGVVAGNGVEFGMREILLLAPPPI
jgi:hypothetical protein